MGAVALPQRNAEMLGREVADHSAELRDLLPGAGDGRLQGATGRDAVGGDRDVQQHVRDRQLIDVVPELTELAHQRRLERAHRVGGDGGAGQRAADALGVERSGIHLVVGQSAQQPALGDLRAAQPHHLAIAFESQRHAIEQAADAREVCLEGRVADVQPPGSLVEVDPVRRIQQHAHQCVQSVAGCRLAVRARAQRIVRAGSCPVPGRARLDGVGIGGAGIERHDIRADAARGHAQQIGETRGGRPLVLPEQGLQEAILTLSRHASHDASTHGRRGRSRMFRRGGKERGGVALSLFPE